MTAKTERRGILLRLDLVPSCGYLADPFSYSLELEGTDPRAVIIPVLPGLKALTVKDVTDGEDWLEELLSAPEDDGTPSARFPSLQYLSLPNTSLFTFPLPEGYTPASVTHLDISANVLNALPATLAQLPHLQSLNIRTNLLTSVRNAVKLVPRVRALNLRDNKIDCLAGLDGLRELQRVDIRHNAIHDVDELSRLAQLPDLREVWAQGNPFTVQDDDSQWRVRVFEAFVSEQGEDVLARLSVDGYLATWAERRTVMGSVKHRGRTGRDRQREGAAARTTSPHAAESARTPSSSRAPPNEPATSTPAAPSNRPRRKQRIVDLDTDSPSDSGAGGHDLPVVNASGVKGTEGVKRAVEDALESPIARKDQDDSPPANGRAASPEQTPYVPPVTLPAADDAEPAEDLRKRMEALRSEVGDSWLSVLAGQARGSPLPSTQSHSPAGVRESDAEPRRLAGPEEAVQVDQVKRKTGKGKSKTK